MTAGSAGGAGGAPSSFEPGDAREACSALHWQRLRPLAFGSFTFVLPLGWEVTAYLLAAEQGQLQFRLREAFVAQLDWRVVSAVPDERRILDAAERRDRPVGARGDARATPLPIVRRGPWSLVEGREGRMHASLYQPSTHLLLVWSFPFRKHETRERLHALLDSYAANAASPRAFALFGLSVLVPDDLAFLRVRAEPADIAVHFRGARGRRVVARRIGMDRALLAGRSLSELAELLLCREGARVESSEARAWFGLPGVWTSFTRRAERGVEPLLARPAQGASQLWRDAREGRIYVLTAWGPDRRDTLCLPDLWPTASVDPPDIDAASRWLP